MNTMKRFVSLALAMAMMFSLLAGCSSKEATTTTTAAATEATTAATEAATEKVLTEAEELELMKQEPAYAEGFTYFASGGCTSAPWTADYLGYFEEYGIKAEVYMAGESWKEALGTNSAQVAVNHIATCLVPAANDVNYAIVTGAMIGCQSLWVLADSEYNSLEDLKGQKISAPNGIGNSSYNIGARFFDADGMNPLTDVEFVQVESSACVAAMESGEIAAVVAGDMWAWDMWKNGQLKWLRSITWDEDFTDEPCCVTVMNKDFIKDNPLMAKYICKAIYRAQEYIGNNVEEITQAQIDEGLLTGDLAKLVECMETYQWGKVVDNAFTERALQEITEDYIRIGLLTTMKDADKVMEKIWWPQYDYSIGDEF
ncbi:MAG: ABC transporter substrate-binding protein [Clostridia bacterium]|nr:ABC transporter substrate-binding protein [Clostridia bacterium]